MDSLPGAATAGPPWQEYGHVFSKRTGEPQHKQVVLRRFRLGLERAGLTPMRVPDLRHGAATMLLAHGATHREIIAVLGHSSVTVSMNIYAQFAPELWRESAERMQRALAGE